MGPSQMGMGMRQHLYLEEYFTSGLSHIMQPRTNNLHTEMRVGIV